MTLYIFILSFILDSVVAYAIDASTDLPDWFDTTESIIDRDYILNKDDNIILDEDSGDKPFSDENLDNVLNEVINDLNYGNDINIIKNTDSNFASTNENYTSSSEGSDNANTSNNRTSNIFEQNTENRTEINKEFESVFSDLVEQNKNVQSQINKEIYSDIVYEEETLDSKAQRELDMSNYLANNSAINVPLRGPDAYDDPFLSALYNIEARNTTINRNPHIDSNTPNPIFRNQTNTSYDDLDLSGLELSDDVYNFDNYHSDDNDDNSGE